MSIRPAASVRKEKREVCKVLQRYLERCKRLNVDQIMAVGTSALRDARNSAEVRARFKEQLGLDVRVISGDEEAGYSFLAVQKGLPLNRRELLVVDVGGGSTEFIRGNAAGVVRPSASTLARCGSPSNFCIPIRYKAKSARRWWSPLRKS